MEIMIIFNQENFLSIIIAITVNFLQDYFSPEFLQEF